MCIFKLQGPVSFALFIFIHQFLMWDIKLHLSSLYLLKPCMPMRHPQVHSRDAAPRDCVGIWNCMNSSFLPPLLAWLHMSPHVIQQIQVSLPPSWGGCSNQPGLKTPVWVCRAVGLQNLAHKTACGDLNKVAHHTSPIQWCNFPTSTYEEPKVLGQGVVILCISGWVGGSDLQVDAIREHLPYNQ